MSEGTDGVRGPRAGFWRRFLAVLIDGVLFGIVGLIMGKLFGQDVITASDGNLSYELTGAPFLVTLAIGAAYLIYFEGGPTGQAVGKKLVGIRVVALEGGSPIGFSTAAVRWAGRFVSGAPLFLGYLWMLWDAEKQTWHDKFAKSIVVPTSAYPVA